jgi:hypothetical protein
LVGLGKGLNAILGFHRNTELSRIANMGRAATLGRSGHRAAGRGSKDMQ